MNHLSLNASRGFRLEATLILMIGLAAGISLAAAVYMPTKWTIFIIFMVVVFCVFLIVREREKLLLYLSVILTSVSLGFHPIFIQSAGPFPWPIRGFRINIFEVTFFFMLVSWLIRLITNPLLKVRFYPWITIPFLLIWCLSLAGLSRVSMPGVIKFSNLWVLLESWLIFLYFANNIRDRQTVYNITIVLLIAGVLQSFLGLAQYLSGGTLGLQIFGETESYVVMMAGTELFSRVAGTFGHPNALAGYLVMLIFINLALFWAPISPRIKLLLCPVFLLISATLVLTFSRGGLLAMGFSGMLTLFLCFQRRSRHGLISFLLAVVLMVVLFVTSVGLISPLRQRLFLEDYGAARSRIPMSHVALNIISHRPWLGVGLGNYTSGAPEFDISRERISYSFPYPVHNEFLLIAAEQGLPILVLFLVILVYIFIQLLRLSRSRDNPILSYLAIGLVGSYFAWCVIQQTRFEYVLLRNLFWLLAGLSLAMVQVSRQEGGDQPDANGQAPQSP